MKEKLVSVFWGVALIIVGGLILVFYSRGIVGISPEVGLVAFSVLCVLFLASYFLSGIQKWGWLFPATFCGALAVTLALVMGNHSGAYLGAPILLSVAIPFIVAYALNTRQNGWALIPIWVMIVLAGVTLVVDNAQGELIGTLVMYAIALPFLFVFLRDRSSKWALIPFAALAVLGVIPLLALQLSGDAMGAVVMFLFAVPFFVVYFWSARNWWALFPAGFFATIGVVVILAATLLAGDRVQSTWAGRGVLFAGWALTFLVLWLRRATIPTGWALYPALGLGILAVISLISSQDLLPYAWPLAIIAAGGWLLYINFRKKSA